MAFRFVVGGCGRSGGAFSVFVLLVVVLVFLVAGVPTSNAPSVVAAHGRPVGAGGRWYGDSGNSDGQWGPPQSGHIYVDGRNDRRQFSGGGGGGGGGGSAAAADGDVQGVDDRAASGFGPEDDDDDTEDDDDDGSGDVQDAQASSSGDEEVGAVDWVVDAAASTAATPSSVAWPISSTDVSPLSSSFSGPARPRWPPDTDDDSSAVVVVDSREHEPFVVGRTSIVTTVETLVTLTFATATNVVPTSSSSSNVFGSKHERTTNLDPLLRPGILAAVIGGAVIGLLAAILFVMFVVYRMKKRDEGSYALDESKSPPSYPCAYQKAPTREFYA